MCVYFNLEQRYHSYVFTRKYVYWYMHFMYNPAFRFNSNSVI